MSSKFDAKYFDRNIYRLECLRNYLKKTERVFNLNCREDCQHIRINGLRCTGKFTVKHDISLGKYLLEVGGISKFLNTNSTNFSTTICALYVAKMYYKTHQSVKARSIRQISLNTAKNMLRWYFKISIKAEITHNYILAFSSLLRKSKKNFKAAENLLESCEDFTLQERKEIKAKLKEKLQQRYQKTNKKLIVNTQYP
ncbi:uncharacterized protein LOC122500597 [Leptopilina heterotoma]|uniref:uncharacterized protein LOC122500597 n=1 Tax=Leptopilina heterotoma TaxID=63436 RepID=UPI001CA98B22|nr:uncharacterized protein LOC122500597 [Leptopilina heterotoma]